MVEKKDDEEKLKVLDGFLVELICSNYCNEDLALITDDDTFREVADACM